MTTPLRRIQLGSGGLNLEGWENYDVDVPIDKPLPFPDACASRIYCSHAIEHITNAEGWNFITECFRVLAPKGVLRVAFPNPVKIMFLMTPEYCAAVKRDYGDGSRRDAIKAVIFAHGHKAVWTDALMMTVFRAIGFNTNYAEYGLSRNPDLCGVEQHGKTVGEAIANLETSVVEGYKP